MKSMTAEEMERVAEAAVEELLETYFREGYAGLREMLPCRKGALERFYREVFLKLREMYSTHSASSTCRAILQRALCQQGMKRFPRLMQEPPIRGSLYSTLALATSCVPEYREAIPVPSGVENSFFLVSSMGLRKADGRELERELSFLLPDIVRFYQAGEPRTCYISHAGAVAYFLKKYPKIITFPPDRDMLARLLRKARETDTRLLPLLLKHEIPLPCSNRAKKERVKELVTLFYTTFFLAQMILTLPEETVSEMEDDYASFLRKLIRDVSRDESLLEKDIACSGSPIVPVLSVLLFGSFPGSIRKLGGEILELTRTPFGKSLLRSAGMVHPSLPDKKVLVSLVQSIEENGESIETHIPASLMAGIPEGTPLSTENRAGMLKSLARHGYPLDRLPFSGDITDALLELTPEQVALFVDFVLSNVDDLSNISLDPGRVGRMIDFHVISTGDVSARHRFELLRDLIGKDRDAAILTILRKIHEIISRKIREAGSGEELEKVIAKAHGMMGGYNHLFGCLYWLSLCENIHLPERDRVLRKVSGSQVKSHLVDVYLSVRKRL